MPKVYEIQAKGHYGDWDAEYVGGPSETLCRTMEEAEKAIEELKQLGEEWANRSYRIMEVERDEEFLKRYRV